jgi:hypothetical protein
MNEKRLKRHKVNSLAWGGIRGSGGLGLPLPGIIGSGAIGMIGLVLGRGDKPESGTIALWLFPVISTRAGIAGIAASVKFPKTSATPLLTRGSGSDKALISSGIRFCGLFIWLSLSCWMIVLRSSLFAVRSLSTKSLTTIGLVVLGNVCEITEGWREIFVLVIVADVLVIGQLKTANRLIAK